MRARNEIISTLGFVERNLSLVKRYLGWEIVFMTYNIVNALTIGFIGVTQGKQFVMYLTIGALVWGFLSVLFHEISESVAWERWEGTIEYTFMAPIHRFTQLMGSCLFAIVYGLIRTVLILFFVALTYHPSPPDVILIEEPENGVHRAERPGLGGAGGGVG